MMDDIHPRLRPQASDLAADLLKVGSSTVDLLFPGNPFGSKVVEFLVDRVLPSRAERFALFLTELSRKVRSLEARLADEPGWWTAAKQALFEDGARTAVRSISDDRISQIAHLVANGLAEDDRRALENHHLLALIEQLSDDDLVVLCAFTPLGMRRDWKEKHRPVLDLLHEVRHPPVDEDPEARSARMERTSQLMTMEHFRENRLVGLGVLERDQHIEVETDRRGQATAKVRKRGLGLSRLGRLVLARLDLPVD